jgi:PPK2 family polyphosphate:nucleotide phosphotransferase
MPARDDQQRRPPSRKALVQRAKEVSEPFRVTNGRRFRLRDIDPRDTLKFTSKDKDRAEDALEWGVEALAHYQDMLYAQDRWSVLLVFQAMDAAGKDGAIKHVMSGINPQGCQVYSFKTPSSEELDHDYLWRCSKAVPERGRIGIFNRSYYEEVLIVRVHPEFLERQRLPDGIVGKHIWKSRYDDMRGFERYLGRNGTKVVKFFLHVSKKEQKRRFLERIDDPSKNWKFSTADAHEREHWDEYMDAYEQMIRHTATEDAPWYVVPADNKWFTRVVIAAAIVDTLDSLDLRYPVLDAAQRRELEAARKMLLGGKKRRAKSEQ